MKFEIKKQHWAKKIKCICKVSAKVSMSPAEGMNLVKVTKNQSIIFVVQTEKG